MTIANGGTSPLTVTGLTGPSGFSANWTSGTIPGGGSQPVSITFAPIAMGSYNGVITVNGDQSGGINTLTVSGTGTLAQATIVADGLFSFQSCIGATCDYSSGARNTGQGCASAVTGTVTFFNAQNVQVGSRATLVPFVRTVRPNESFTVLALGVPTATKAATVTAQPEFSWTNVACP
jgi:hypothetical protein